MTLKERMDVFFNEYKDKGYYISKHHTIKEKKVNQYGKEYEYPIAEILSLRVPTRTGSVREFFYVIVFRNKWFQYADGEKYLNDKKFQKEKFMICDDKIFQWIRDFNRPTETIITLALPNQFLFVRWYELLKKSRNADGLRIFYPYAFQVDIGTAVVCLVHESLFVNRNPYDILQEFENDDIVIGQEIDLNSYFDR